MLDILASIFGGGITGLLGGIITKIFDYLNAKQRMEQEKLKWEHEERVLQIETNRDVVIAREQAAATKEAAEFTAMAESFKSDKANYFVGYSIADLPNGLRWIVAILMVLVDFIRGITRPGLTLYLCVVSTYFYIKLQEILATAKIPMNPDQAYELSKMIILAMLYLTTTAVGWWFASRTKLSDIMGNKNS